jgi:hypothetical protein
MFVLFFANIWWANGCARGNGNCFFWMWIANPEIPLSSVQPLPETLYKFTGQLTGICFDDDQQKSLRGVYVEKMIISKTNTGQLSGGST